MRWWNQRANGRESGHENEIGDVDCRACHHFSDAPMKPDLFDPSEVANSEVVARQIDRQRRNKQQEDREHEIALSDSPTFSYRPAFLPVCQFWTAKARKEQPRNIYGDPVLVYEVCASHNPTKHCNDFRPRQP